MGQLFVLFLKYLLFEYFLIGNGERGKLSKKCTPLHTLEGKHSELWHNIFVRCFDTVTTPLDLEHTLFLRDDKVIRMSVQMEILCC